MEYIPLGLDDVYEWKMPTKLKVLLDYYYYSSTTTTTTTTYYYLLLLVGLLLVGLLLVLPFLPQGLHFDPPARPRTRQLLEWMAKSLLEVVVDLHRVTGHCHADLKQANIRLRITGTRAHNVIKVHTPCTHHRYSSRRPGWSSQLARPATGFD